MNRRFAIAAVLALSLGALPVLAQGPGFGPGGQGPGQGRGRMGGPGGLGPILPGLNQLSDLSETQREQIRSIVEASRPATDPGEAVRKAEQALHTAVLAATPNLAAIESAKAAINAAHAAELDHRVDVMEKVAAVLTPAQRQQLASFTPPAGGGRGGV